MHEPTIQLVLFFFTASFCTAQGSDSCPYAPLTLEHSFCLPPNPECKIVEHGVTPEDIEIILKVHNGLRNKVAKGEETTGGLEPATNMLQLVWDKDLAAVAQNYADQCKPEHDCEKCRRLTEDESVGQNIYVVNGLLGFDDTYKSKWENAIMAYYGGVEWFDKNTVKNYSYVNAELFTQVIWAKSERIGCGFTAYQSDSEFTENLHICNYAPAGIVVGEQVYEEGPPCSNCPEGSTCGKGEYEALCVMSEPEGEENEAEAAFTQPFNDEFSEMISALSSASQTNPPSDFQKDYSLSSLDKHFTVNKWYITVNNVIFPSDTQINTVTS